ncbi:F0F1 ATP synthase subunit C [Helicobacter sp. MIT 14-3879]|uniref:F0F1 ATP synthase subunit C n=1 Tax=Helicobacter sp. MIT 14-3879 TaxID=2040649 RepID=UPI000E1E6013|nr:F0F1 ATP synthase subunit C [Helicobacter sp. MIT 14-3879]RDU64147.1 ATP synthase F0 subunit C [Helicobacter sp. MIT 14-3879]
MKKIFLVFLAFAGIAFAQDGSVSGVYLIKAYSAIGAVVGLGIAALGGAIGMGNVAGAAISGIARNPGVGGKLTTTMFIAIALIEAQVIYTFIVALIVLYFNPLLK